MLENSKINIYLKYAFTSFLRRKQRTLFSLLAISISVASIVAISLMGASVETTLQSSVKYYFGGDLRLDMETVGFRIGKFDFKDTIKQTIEAGKRTRVIHIRLPYKDKGHEIRNWKERIWEPPS